MAARLGLAAAIGLCVSAGSAWAACPPKGYDRDGLAALKTEGWRLAEQDARDALAKALVACLASPDPELRDGMAFDALQTLLRGKGISVDAMNDLYTNLMPMLEGPKGGGFARPFAALALAEIARADRAAPFLSAERRTALLGAAGRFLAGHDDYRGFDPQEGWRHGVAHGADLLMQLSLNPAFGKPDLARIQDAIAAKVSPTGHAYTFGESERLARPILFIARRGVFTEAEWSAWLTAVAAFDGDPYGDTAGLARRHNVTAFLSALYVNVSLGDDAADDGLLPGLEAAIRALP